VEAVDEHGEAKQREEKNKEEKQEEKEEEKEEKKEQEKEDEKGEKEGDDDNDDDDDGQKGREAGVLKKNDDNKDDGNDEKIGSELETDITERGIQADVDPGDYKEQRVENKDASNDDFMTQEEGGEKTQVEKTVATERPKWVMKPINKFTPIEKKKTLQKNMPIMPKAAI
ncbi:hypothetical protein PanWU01x14_124250, partial [Parasponia andersonii]